MYQGRLPFCRLGWVIVIFARMCKDLHTRILWIYMQNGLKDIYIIPS